MVGYYTLNKAEYHMHLVATLEPTCGLLGVLFEICLIFLMITQQCMWCSQGHVLSLNFLEHVVVSSNPLKSRILRVQILLHLIEKLFSMVLRSHQYGSNI